MSEQGMSAGGWWGGLRPLARHSCCTVEICRWGVMDVMAVIAIKLRNVVMIQLKQVVLSSPPAGASVV
jgi:hypothetical protein